MEVMYETEHVRRLHIELSSKCNASCPACSRNFSGGLTVPGLEMTELSLQDIKRMVPVEIASNLTAINYCGNLGDPGTANELVPVLRYFREQSPEIVQHVRTNGGMRGEKFWTEIGEFFRDQPPPKDNHLFNRAGVVFSVDGLSDTNHIYRRGVIWDKLIRNMTAYSKTGAKAAWEFLIFEHNQHQVEEARHLAGALGFDFVIKNPMGFGEYEDTTHGIHAYSNDGTYEYTIWPANYNGIKAAPPFGKQVDFTALAVDNETPITDFARELERNSEINCRAIEHRESQEVYISATGYMLPCCFMGGIFGNFNSSYSRKQFNTMITEYGLEHFDLKQQSMLDIINGPHFSKFFLDGWKAEKIECGKLLYCLEVCGHNSAIDKLYHSKQLKK
jgi:MoaA/NifB/PqqE/SkfB family radical SAM enzyme